MMRLAVKRPSGRTENPLRAHVALVTLTQFVASTARGRLDPLEVVRQPLTLATNPRRFRIPY
jgi:hypothetical protein